MLENPHGIDEEQWRKWPQTSRLLFNHLYEYTLQNQSLFSHPLSAEVPAEHWKTTAWNTAWEAASQFKEILETSHPIHPHGVRETPV